MRDQTIHALAKPLRRVIGKHHQLIGKCAPQEQYLEAQRASDDAVSLAKYLIQHLDNRHDAVRFAHAVGMPGYINMR